MEWVCVCVCVRGTGSHHSGVYSPSEIVLIAACVQTHTSIITVCHVTLFPSRAWTDGKTKDIINCLYIYFESWSSWLWRGVLHFRCVLVVFGQSQCTGSVGQSEQTALVVRRDFVENEAEAGHRGPTIMYSIWKIMCFLNIKACQHILLHQIHKLMIFKKASYDPFKVMRLLANKVARPETFAATL